MNVKRGDVCLVHFPFTDGSAAKLRPALVISDDEFNRGDDIVVLPISSRPDESDPHSLFIGPPWFRSAGLKQESSIKWTKPTTISKVVLQSRLGTIPIQFLDEACNNLKRLFRII